MHHEHDFKTSTYPGHTFT